MEEICQSYLPCANFRNVYTWILYQHFRTPVHYLIGLLICGFSFWFFKKGDSYSFLPALPNVLLAIGYSASTRAVTQHLEVLCEEVIKIQPGANLSKWDVVAAHINERLYRSGAWYNPYCIYDGEYCISLFRLLVLGPFYKGTHDEQNTLQAEAAAIYERNLDSWWRACRKEAEICCYSGEQKLPRDFIRPKVAWLLKNTYECRFTRISLASMFLMFLPLAPPPWKPFTSIYSCDPPRVQGFMIGCAIFFMIFSFCYYWARFYDVRASHSFMLLAIIVEVKPKTDTMAWDNVAKQFNAYLQREKVWPTPEFFYDGNDCLWAFNKFVSSDTNAPYPLHGS